MCITDITKDGEYMILQIDFNSDEAIYIQLRNQIIIGIATETIKEGDPLPSVRQMADNIGINMHTVNKAYSVLKQEGFVKLDRRKGAVVALDVDKMRVLDEMRRDLSVVLARGICKNVPVTRCTSLWMRFSCCFPEVRRRNSCCCLLPAWGCRRLVRLCRLPPGSL